MKKRLGLGVQILSCVAAGALTSCGPSPEPSPIQQEDGDLGSIGLAVQVVPGVDLARFSYSITGPGGYAKTGQSDVGKNGKISALIGSLPVGSGFSVTIDAATTDSDTRCVGSASFSVTARTTTSVVVRLQCREGVHTGGLLVSGLLNVCPVVDGITAAPSDTAVGGTMSLAAAAHDTDAAPSPLSYLWSANGGTLTNETSATPTFTCTAAGPVTVSVTVTDGDCSDTLTANVNCTAPQTPLVVINEVESNGGVPGDWVELYNVGATPADISGWKFKDNDDTHAFYVVPAGTVIAPGAYYLMEEAQFVFGLGGADPTRLFDASGVPVDTYSWTAHATTTYGRCPNGSGAFATTASSTKGGPNDCGGGGGTGGATGSGGTSGTGGAGAGGVTGSGGVTGTGGTGGATSFAWPGTDTVVSVDTPNTFGSNLSGLNYQGATPTSAAVLWAVQNGPSKIYRLLNGGTVWTPDTSGGWNTGKLLHYPDGTGAPDSEGLTHAEWTDPAIYVSTERDNNNNGVSRLGILRFDSSAAGTELTATNDWNVTSDIPVVGPNLGLEAITYIPDTALVAAGFVDESTHAAYAPALYPDHGSGLFFVGVEGNGVVYGYALNHVSNTFTRIATFPSGQVSIMDLSYDRDTGFLWGYCDNTCGNKATVFRVDTTPGSPTLGHFVVSRVFDRAPTLPDTNNEGITFAPESECVLGQKAFFWSDDNQLNGNAIRRGSIPCGVFF